MEISKTLDDGVYNITLSGRFTFSDHPAFRDILQKFSDDHFSEIVFHMQKVEFVDSAALGMLLLANDEAERNKKRLVISGAAGQVKKMFEMAKFNAIFKMH